MIKPNPVVIDGNIFLMAHSSAILGAMKPKDIIHNSTHENIMYRGRGIIIKSFMSMIFKNVEDMFKKGYNPTSICIVWDKRLNGKYHKSTIIDKLESDSGYKGDRTYLTESDLNELESKYENATNPEEEAKYEEEILSAKKSLIIDRERYHAREFIKANLPKFGISSISLAGWEADDLDYIFALETDKRGGTQIHYSGDSDWAFNLRGDDVFWQVNRGFLYKKDSNDIRKKYDIPEGLSLQDWAEINFSARGSHNFLRSTIDPSIKKITKKIKAELFSGDFSKIHDVKRFEIQRECFKIESFPDVDKVVELYKKCMSLDITVPIEEFKSLLNELSMKDDQKFFMNKNYVDLISKVRISILSQIK